MSSSPAYIVSTTMRASGCAGESPDRLETVHAGSCRSISVTSGWCCRNCSTASSPLLPPRPRDVSSPDNADDAFAHQPVVVDAEDANRGPFHGVERSATGATTGRHGKHDGAVPGLLEIRKWPPIFSARSLML